MRVLVNRVYGVKKACALSAVCEVSGEKVENTVVFMA